MESQLDGGVSVTATAVYGIAQLALQQGKAPAASKVSCIFFFVCSLIEYFDFFDTKSVHWFVCKTLRPLKPIK